MPPVDRDEVIEELDRALLAIRHLVTRPPAHFGSLAGDGPHVDLAKGMACQVVSDLGAGTADIAVKDVAAALHLERSTTSRLLGQCEADGYLVRRRDPEDRRRTLIALTERGTEAARAFRDARTAVLRSVLREWSTPDLQAAGSIMKRLADLGPASLAAAGRTGPDGG